MIRHLTELAALAGKVFAVLGTLAAASYAVAGDRIVPASQDYVNMRFAQLRDLQLDIANGKLESAQRDRDKLELDFLKAQTQEERTLNQQAQRRTQETIDKLKDQIRTISSK